MNAPATARGSGLAEPDDGDGVALGDPVDLPVDDAEHGVPGDQLAAPPGHGAPALARLVHRRRLARQLAVEVQHRVAAEHDGVVEVEPAGHRGGLRGRQRRHLLRGRGVRARVEQRVLVDVGDLDAGVEARGAEQAQPGGGGGGEDDVHADGHYETAAAAAPRQPRVGPPG